MEGGGEGGDNSNHNDLNYEIDSLFDSTSSKRTINSKKEEDAERSHEEIANAKSRHDCKQFYSSRRRTISDLHGSVCMSSISRPYEKKRQERKNILAMKCLRPNIPSITAQFIIGVEDLVQETAASLPRPS